MRYVVDPATGCWVWQKVRGNGYGEVLEAGVRKGAHRAFYEKHKGPIPAGLVIDHLCRNPACVNPEHLEAVTERENLLRGEGACAKNARKTHCPKGHPYEGGNLHIRPDGGRRCRACAAEYQRRRKGRPHTPTRTHCKRGHLLDDANTYVDPGGKRGCRVCRNINAQAYRDRQKAAA